MFLILKIGFYVGGVDPVYTVLGMIGILIYAIFGFVGVVPDYTPRIFSLLSNISF